MATAAAPKASRDIQPHAKYLFALKKPPSWKSSDYVDRGLPARRVPRLRECEECEGREDASQ